MTVDAAIIGAGAMGSCLAFHLANTGLQVGLLARGHRLSWLRQNGVQLSREGQISSVQVDATDDVAALFPARVLFLCTKTGPLPEVLETITEHVSPGTIVVTVQNGVEAPQQVQQALPDCHVIATRVHGFFEMEGDVVRHVGVEPSFLMGGTGNCPSSLVQDISGLLERSGLAAPISENIERDLWEKLLLAAAIGGVGTAVGKAAGRICEDHAQRDMLRSAMFEIAHLARVRGIAIADAVAEEALAFVESFPPDATSSLQRDLEAGRPSEYDAHCGAVLRLAGEAGVEVPVHRRIDAVLRQRGLVG